MGKKKNNFLLSDEWKALFCDLPDEKAGQLIKMAFCYHTGDEYECDDPVLNAVFSMIREKIDKNDDAYKKQCEVNRENGKSGGRPKKATETENNRMGFSETETRRKNPDSDNDNDKEKGVSKDTPKKKAEELVEFYNETCTDLPKVAKLTDNRIKTLNSRIKDFGVDEVKRCFEMANSSDFLKGDNKNGWKATFDWLITSANMTKVLEGNYENRKKKQAFAETRSDSLDAMFASGKLGGNAMQTLIGSG